MQEQCNKQAELNTIPDLHQLSPGKVPWMCSMEEGRRRWVTAKLLGVHELWGRCQYKAYHGLCGYYLNNIWMHQQKCFVGIRANYVLGDYPIAMIHMEGHQGVPAHTTPFNSKLQHRVVGIYGFEQVGRFVYLGNAPAWINDEYNVFLATNTNDQFILA